MVSMTAAGTFWVRKRSHTRPGARGCAETIVTR